MSWRYLLLSSLFFVIFVIFTYIVHKDLLVQWDFDTTVRLQDHLPHRLDEPFSLFSLIGMAEVTGIIWMVTVLLSLIKKAWLVAISLFSFWAGIIIELFGKVIIDHPSPPFLFYRGVFDFEFPSSYVRTGSSYPSGHMFRSTFLISFLIAVLLRKKHPAHRLLTLLAGAGFLVLMAVSRVYLGEHWSTDVIGGFLLGSSLGLFSATFLPDDHKEV